MATKDALITRISDQIRVEEKYGRALEEGKRRLSRTKYWMPLPMILLFGWVAICWMNNISPMNFLVMWVVGSYFIYMFYFFLMMIPSLGSDSTHHLLDGDAHIHIREFLRLANLLRRVRRNKVTLLETFWNAFLINTKPLAKGFALMHAVDIICAGVLYLEGVIDLSVFLIIGAQVLVILAFYAKIVLAKPDTPGFFVGKPLTSPKAGESEAAKLKIWLYISLFAMLTGLLIVGATLVPGLTLGGYLATPSILPSEYPNLL